jgi:hypothetical protein
MLYGEAVWCALLLVLLFFFCSWSREIETLPRVTRDLQIHRKSSIHFCHPWKTDRPDIIRREIHETGDSVCSPHWAVIVRLFQICIDTWLRWIVVAARVLVRVVCWCVVMCVDINKWYRWCIQVAVSVSLKLRHQFNTFIKLLAVLFFFFLKKFLGVLSVWLKKITIL